MRNLRIASLSLFAALALVAPAVSASAVVPTPPATVTDLPTVYVTLTDLPAKDTLSFIQANKDIPVASQVDIADGTTTQTLKCTTLPTDAAPDGVACPNIKGHGNFTWTLDKKSYQLKFDKKTAVLGMLPGKTWILIANRADPSLLRNRTTLELARQFGMYGTPESRFVDLVVNGQDLGSYLLTDKVTVTKFDATKPDSHVALTNTQGVLVEMDSHYGAADPFHFTTAKSKSIFTLKDSYVGFKNDPGVVLDADTQAGWNDAQSTINTLEGLLYAPNPDWTKISALIDVDSFIKYYFVSEFVENPDVASSSVYFYKDGPTDKLHAGPVWDYDISLGNYANANRGGNPTEDYVKNELLTVKGNGPFDWWTQLFRNQSFAAQANATYETLKSSVSDVPTKIDSYQAHLLQSAAHNFVVWPNILGQASVIAFNGGHSPITSTWAAEVALLRTWASQRASYLAHAYGANVPVLRYSAQVQNIGWQPTVSTGQMVGTTGRSLRAEAIKITDTNTTTTGAIVGNAHVQNLGWMGYQAPGAVIGTIGRSLRMEAIQLKLTGALATSYNISYRVFVQNRGWMSWVSNGATAGTTGLSLRIEALQIRIAKK
ncbi:hypothetical protein GCM10009868_08590 [Terrabacter aerolatus]|uniref:Hydrophobic W protein n=1 Tax=Terrabacter aerolatus TaxID=422442 RepID=A0A512D5V3_9MICO|nr:CotH kinase family protein [Terrabacter aerolatus]GEO31856.1 hypothetical protein TAE01_36660 [Terrabacter aerolatus]